MARPNAALLDRLVNITEPVEDLNRAIGLAIGWLREDPTQPEGRRLYYIAPDDGSRVGGGLGDYVIIPDFLGGMDVTLRHARRLGLSVAYIERQSGRYNAALRWEDQPSRGHAGYGGHPDMHVALVRALLTVELRP